MSEFIHVFNASTKAAMDLLFIVILVQFLARFIVASKQSLGNSALSGLVLRAGLERINKIFACK